MKLFKKIMILCLMAIAVCKNMEAGLYNKPSLLAQVCSIVPFKTSLALGLGLMGTAAYCWYKVPQLEVQLAKAEYLPEPVMEKSIVGDVEKDLALLKVSAIKN